MGKSGGSSCWFNSQMPTMAGNGAGAEPGQSRSHGLNPDLLCGWQESNYLSHHCCLPGSALAESWSQGLTLESNPNAVMQDMGI